MDSAADVFLAALTEELIPFIEANYRTLPSDRCLYGYSSSGFFVLYALFHRPHAFRRYISGSGDLYIAYPYVIQHDAELAAAPPPTRSSFIFRQGNWRKTSFPTFTNSSRF